MASEPTIQIRRINLPITLLISSVIAAASAWGVAQVARSKLDDTIKDVSDLKARVLPAAIEMQKVNDRLDSVQQSLDRLEKAAGTK